VGELTERAALPDELVSYVLRVNGREHHVADAWFAASLLSVLRDHLGLRGAKNACEQGECGACSVLVDGSMECSCTMLAAGSVGHEIVTVEGIPGSDGVLSDVQQAFVDAGAVQCGFCTPGLVVAAHDLLARKPAATELEIREAISGNLCRCTGYGRILAAVEAVRDARTGGSA
jgi:carbon-monoxide dehydrogenase small subunit